MQAEVSEIDPVTVEITVNVPWDRVQKGLDDTLGKLQRTAKIKGFRPGKAPRAVIQRLYGKDVRQEVVSNLVEATVVEAVQKHEIPVVSNAMMADAPTLTDGQPLSFKVKFEVRPKVGELSTALNLTRWIEEVADADIDAEIARLREQHAVLRAPETPRPAKEGDQLLIDYSVLADGEEQAEMGGKDRPVELGTGTLIAEIDQGLLGANVGETKQIEVKRESGDPEDPLAGKQVVFAVTVKELQEKILPEADDEFAKDVGEHQTLAELCASIRTRLEDAAKGRSESQLREDAVEKLADANPVPVPPSLIEQQLRSMMQEYMNIMRYIGQQPNMDAAQVDGMKRRAEQKVRSALLLGELSRVAKIEVSEEEIEARFREMAEKSGKHVAKVKAEHQGEKRESLETQILEKKLIDHLLAGAVIKERPAAEREAEEKAEAAKADAASADAASADAEPAKKASDKADETKAEKPAKKASAKTADASDDSAAAAPAKKKAAPKKAVKAGTKEADAKGGEG